MGPVLLIDPDLRTREVLTLYEDELPQLVQAATGEEGLAVLQGQRVELVILEYRLSDLSGLEVLARIKTVLPQVPVIILTAYGSESVCASALKLGARDYFVKPLNASELVLSICSLLSSASRHNEPRDNALAAKQIRRMHLSYQSPTIGLDEVTINRATRFVQEHYWEDVSLAMIARHVGMSKFVLCRKFKAVRETTPHKFLVRCRLEKSRNLLKDSIYSITEVAQMVGFSDLPRFDKVFKNAAGMAPSKYRALYGQGRTRI